MPVISPEMDVPLARNVELQLAGRFEDYSDLGNVAKPKVAMAWDLFDGVRIRGSWAQGFKAPNLEQINATVVTRANNRTDWVRCEADLRAKRIASFSNCSRSMSVSAQGAGNPDLQPQDRRAESDRREAAPIFQRLSGLGLPALFTLLVHERAQVLLNRLGRQSDIGWRPKPLFR